jgi:hypothetical protein
MAFAWQAKAILQGLRRIGHLRAQKVSGRRSPVTFSLVPAGGPVPWHFAWQAKATLQGLPRRIGVLHVPWRQRRQEEEKSLPGL